MAEKFTISKTNHTLLQDVQAIQDIHFRAWAQFLKGHSLIAFALNTSTILNVGMLQRFWCTAVDTSNAQGYAFSFTLPNGTVKRITEQDVNRTLHFPLDNFIDPLEPNEEQIHDFFNLIRCQQEDFYKGEFLKNYLPKHWNFFFHVLILVFTPRTTNKQSISFFLQRIGYAVANNRRLNFGKVLIEQIILSLGPLEDRDLQHHNVECLYPRFIQLILNGVLTEAEKELFPLNEVEPCMKMKMNVITRMINKSPFPEVPTVLTPYLSTLPLELQPPNQPGIGEPQGIIPNPINPVVESDPMEIDNTVPEPTVAISDQEVEDQQPLSPVIEPFIPSQDQPTIQNPNPTTPENEQPVSVEGDSALAAPHKETPSTSIALPPRKRIRTEPEASIEHLPNTSQTDFQTALNELEAGNWSFLSFEISQPVNPQIEEELTETVSDPTILRSGSPTVGSSMNHPPSPASEGKFDSLPTPTESLSPLPGGTFLAPQRDFPLADLSGESGRQLVDYDSDSSDESNKDGDLRSPIAPSVTSLRSAQVISLAGTTGSQNVELSVMSETPAERLSETPNPNLSEQRVLSETPPEPVSETQQPNVRSDTLALQHVASPRPERELHAELTIEEQPVYNREGNVVMLVPTRSSFAKRHPIAAKSDRLEDKLMAIDENVQHATGNSKRTYMAIASASGTITGTKQSVDALRKEAIEELVELRSDVREVRDGVINDIHLIQQCHESLQEDVMVVRDGQATVKDTMNRLSRVESKLNQRLAKLEKSTSARLDSIDHRLNEMESKSQQRHNEVLEFLDNQNDGVQAIFTMLKNQEASRKSLPQQQQKQQQSHPHLQPVGPSSYKPPIEWPLPLEDYSTKGEKRVETPPSKQYFDDFITEGDLEPEHEPYEPEYVESVPAQGSSMAEREESEFIKTVKAQKEESDNRHKENLKQQAQKREEQLKRFKKYDEERERRRMDLTLKQGPEWEQAFKTFHGIEDALEVNNNHEIESFLDDLKTANPNTQTYYSALKHAISSLKVGLRQKGTWNIVMHIFEKGTYFISSKFFETRSFTELQVLLIKISRSTKMNELLRELVMTFLIKASPEICKNPPVVKFIRNNIFRNCYLDGRSLSLYPSEELIRVERMLRTTGVETAKKSEAANTIREYLMMHVPSYRRYVEKGQDILPDLPKMSELILSEEEKEDDLRRWEWAMIMQEAEFQGVRGLMSKLTHRETDHYKYDNEVITEYLTEEGEIVEE